MLSSEFYVGRVVWLADKLFHKPTRKVISAKPADYRVVSYDARGVAIVRDDRIDKNVRIWDLVSLRFAEPSECHATEAEAALECQKIMAKYGAKGTEPSPTGATGRTE